MTVARLELEVDASTLHIRMDRIKRGVAGTEMLDTAGHYVASTMLPLRFREAGPGWPSVARGGAPLRDTGALSKSFSHVVTGRSAIVSSNAIYAGPQHRGDTVTPKTGKYLAIPLPTLTISERRTKGPRDFADTRICKSKKGNLLVWRQTGTKPYTTKSGRAGKPVPVWEPIFVLKASVKLKARRFMYFSDANVVAIKRRMAKVLRFFATGEAVGE